MSPPIDTDRLIRPTTAARLLGVTRDAVHKWVARKKLTAVRVDGRRTDRWTMTRRGAAFMTDHDWLELLMVLLTFLAQKLSH